MAAKKAKSTAVLGTHPLVKKLGTLKEPAVELRGYVGEAHPGMLRLYSGFDLTNYVEFPKADVLHAEQDKQSPDGGVRVFVPASTKLTHVYCRRAELMAADAEEMGLSAKRFEMLAGMMQEQMEDESEIIKTIMESKNRIVEAVMRMMLSAFATRSKVMAVGTKN